MTASDKSMNNSKQKLRVTYTRIIRHRLYESAHRTQLIAIYMNERVYAICEEMLIYNVVKN